jgi:mediator of replication checkpoint protein 1
MESKTSATSHKAAVPSKPRTTLLGALRKSTIHDSSDSSAESDSSTSESEEDTPISARPLAESRPQLRMDSPEAAEESDADAAYQRMRKRLAAEKAKETQPTQQDIQNQTHDSVPAISSGEEDTIPVRNPARKVLTTTEKTASPAVSLSPRIRSRHSSPGLFVSPNPSPMKSQSRTLHSIGSDSDDSTRHARNTDMQERVKRIRAERLAKEKEQQRTRQAAQHPDSDTDGEVDRRLTQQAKPTRRAGKKALEAMARDQQRISRNMQLTHQSKTKKRFSTKDLFSRFGLDTSEETAAATLPTPETSSAVASSDTEANQMHEIAPQDLDSAARLEKGKGRAPEFQHLPVHSWMQPKPVVVQQVQIQERPSNDDMVELSDSDDEVVTAKPKTRFPVFDRVPLRKQQEAPSMLHLRHLAHLTSPKNTRKGPKTISQGEMHLLLAQKARQQAQKEREEKLQELRRRGIHIETEEEREKNQMEIEDMVAQFEKQRQEDLKLAKMERKEAKDNGERVDDLPSSDDSDDDFVGSGEENAEEQNGDESEAEIELSGSEDEEMGEADAANENEAAPDVSLEQHIDDDVDMDEEPSAPGRKQVANRARRRVVDDEDESDNETRPSTPTQQATQDDTKAAFGFATTDTGVGLTQMFAGTMANLESDSQATIADQVPEQDSFDFLRSLPDTQPAVNFSQTEDEVVPNSQSYTTPRKESQFSLGISQLAMESPGFSRTQLDDIPEPTQDVGFSFSRSPAGLMPPPSTVETIMMSVSESPVQQRKGRLQRGLREAALELSDAEEDFVDIASDLSDVDDIQRAPKHRDAFRAMQKGAKKQRAVDEFNKKNSLAKNIVEEQADESEDEYAGLGGASDDDSGEEDEDMAKMIDHNDVKVDERQIAAFYA